LGVFIALNHQITVGVGLLSMGAPDSPMRRHVTQPLGFGRSRPLELCLLVAPDMYCSLSGAPLATALTSACTVLHCSRSQLLLQSTVARRSCCSAGAPDSPVNFSGARLEKPEGGEFGVVRSWHTGQSGAPDQGTLGSFAPLILDPNFVLLLVCVEPLCTYRIYNLEQTS
jgi:hypothetical protein